MKQVKNEIFATVTLGTNYSRTLNHIINDEFKKACEKWDLDLNSEAKSKIKEHALNQLKRKVQDVVRCPYNLTDTVEVKIMTLNKPLKINVPNVKNGKSNVKVVRLRDGWEVDVESQENSVFLKDFDSKMREDIETWLRTAVFYGVASYT